MFQLGFQSFVFHLLSLLDFGYFKSGDKKDFRHASISPSWSKAIAIDSFLLKVHADSEYLLTWLIQGELKS